MEIKWSVKQTVENNAISLALLYRVATKKSLFFFGNNFYKNKETFKIFSPQLPEVYRIFLVDNHSRINNVLLYFFSN